MLQYTSLQRLNDPLLLAMGFSPSAPYADAIFPTLLLAWPITILLFVPVILIEAVYARSRLRMGFWESVRVVGVANVLSAIAGLPLATGFSLGLKYVLESVYFRDIAALRAQATALRLTQPERLGSHDTMTLMWLGLYPRWIMLVSAVAMMILCFLVSWWVEGKWISRYIRGREPNLVGRCSVVARNANLLSYAFLTAVFLFALISLWPNSIKAMFG